MKNQNLIVGGIVALIIGAAVFFFFNKKKGKGDEVQGAPSGGGGGLIAYAKSLIKSGESQLTDAQAEKVVAFAHSQILNRADGKTGWLDSVTQKAQDRGISVPQMAVKDGLYHLRKHNKI